MGRVILDSSVVIASLNDRDYHHSAAVSAISSGKHENFISALTLAESLVGIKSNSVLLETSRTLQAELQVIDVDAEIADLTSKYRTQSGLKLPDAVICATASIHKLQLWTFDTKQSRVVAGSRLLETK